MKTYLECKKCKATWPDETEKEDLVRHIEKEYKVILDLYDWNKIDRFFNKRIVLQRQKKT